MEKKTNNKIFNIYEFLDIDKSERKEVILGKILNKAIEINKGIESNQFHNFQLILHIQNVLLKIAKYFRTEEGKKRYDEMIENQIKQNENINKKILFEKLIDLIEELEKRYKMNVDIEYFSLLEIVDFITNISNKNYRKNNSKMCNFDFARNLIIRAFNNAYLNKRRIISVNDFITVTFENENLKYDYRKQFASVIFDNWYPTLKK